MTPHDDEPRIYVRHLRQMRYCLIPGGRGWFSHHGLDWRDFVRNGIAVSAVAHIDDALCRNVAALAIKEYETGKGRK